MFMDLGFSSPRAPEQQLMKIINAPVQHLIQCEGLYSQAKISKAQYMCKSALVMQLELFGSKLTIANVY